MMMFLSHVQVLELTQKSERTITNLEMKVGSLEKEVATHNAGVDELNREHNSQLETLRTDKAMLEVGCVLHVLNWGRSFCGK